MKAQKLIIGLGNPGEKYKNNRHNVGHLFVTWAKKEGFFSKEAFLTKTDCFMNESGGFVKKEAKKHWTNLTNLTNLFVMHDDLDIPLGKFKIQLAVGPKVHNGLDSVEQELGSKDFWRVRIGVDARDPLSRIPGEDYVLRDFTKVELEILEKLFPMIWEGLQDKFRIDNLE